MVFETVYLFDQQFKEIAKVSITSMNGKAVTGIIITHKFSEEFCELFIEYQHLIETQIFSLLDEYEAKIQAQHITVKFENEERSYQIDNLQVYDLQVISFLLAE